MSKKINNNIPLLTAFDFFFHPKNVILVGRVNTYSKIPSSSPPSLDLFFVTCYLKFARQTVSTYTVYVTNNKKTKHRLLLFIITPNLIICFQQTLKIIKSKDKMVRAR